MGEPRLALPVQHAVAVPADVADPQGAATAGIGDRVVLQPLTERPMGGTPELLGTHGRAVSTLLREVRAGRCVRRNAGDAPSGVRRRALDSSCSSVGQQSWNSV